jgi:Zn ribbon nucleic-acid-binding protein
MPKFRPKEKLTNRKCPRCQTEDKSKWTKNGYKHSRYCRECQKYYCAKKRSKTYEKIMKATNNGKCWWLYQSIIAELNNKGGT